MIDAVYPTDEAAEKARLRTLNTLAANMAGSRILGIASQVRARVAEGQTICNLTVGDFSPAHFKAPVPLREKIAEFSHAGQTNYPPADGIPELKKAIVDFYAKRLGVRFPVGSVVVGSGARPPLYATYANVLSEGDLLVYAAPSWNNEYYAYLNGARTAVLQTRPEDGFMPTLKQIEPYLSEARLVHLNSPLNPCGTAIDEAALTDICRAIVAENARREAEGRPALVLVYDMVYWMLTFGDTKHVHPVGVVPEIAPYVVLIDAISKSFAATGLRVGWGIVPPHIQGKYKALVGHMGAWAPRPEQQATAWFLEQSDAVDAFMGEFIEAIGARLDLIHSRFEAMRASGLPVQALRPQGAIYLSIQIDLRGRRLPNGEVVETNEQVRQYLLDDARIAVVPFQAFGLEGDTGWFRMSVGAVGLDELREGLERLEQAVRAAT